jgi:hypothetical protein
MPGADRRIPPDMGDTECYLVHTGGGFWRCIRAHRPPTSGHAVIVTTEAAMRILADVEARYPGPVVPEQVNPTGQGTGDTEGDGGAHRP